jgi:beta-ureidopropionase
LKILLIILTGVIFAGVAGCGSPSCPHPASVNQVSPNDRSSSDEIVVAQIKARPVSGDLAENHRRLMHILEQIEKSCRVDVVVTPEGWLDGYIARDENITKNNIVQYAVDPVQSEYTQGISAWGQRNRAWVILGCTRQADGKAYNTAIIYNRQGQFVGWYDKLHLQKHDLKYTAGNRLDVFDSDFGLFGVMICADRRWPETARTLALKGARIIFNPTYGFKGDLNTCMMRTRSYENGIYIAFTHPDQSLITGPKGQVICLNENAHSDYTLTTVNLIKANPLKYSLIRDRRPDVYDLK